jgi:hypothetical protein
MTRKRGRRSTRKPIDELIAEIRQARQEWESLSLEEGMKAGREKRGPTPEEAPPSFFCGVGEPMTDQATESEQARNRKHD